MKADFSHLLMFPVNNSKFLIANCKNLKCGRLTLCIL